MSEVKQFKLPDVGEGLTEADIVKWHVQPGDHVEVNQTIVEIETAKAIVELPCPYEGVVAGLHADEGETVDVGVPIISVDVSGGAATAAGPESPGPVTREAALSEELVPAPDGDAGAGAVAEQPKRTPVLVGYGVKPGATRRRPRKRPATATGPGAGPGSTGPSATGLGAAGLGAGGLGAGGLGSTGSGAAAPAVRPQAVDRAAPAAGPVRTGSASGSAVLAKPPIRKLARDLGVDLALLTGSGPQGSISRQDVLTAAGVTPAGHPAPASGLAGAGLAAPEADLAALEAEAASSTALESPGARTGGLERREQPEERIPVKGVRKQTAAAMVASAFTAPHVTEFLQVDVTETMKAVRRLRELPDFAGVKVSPLLLVAKALLLAVRRHPAINAKWSDDEIIVRHYVNLGIAAATERGLIVPNIKNAQELSLIELAKAFNSLAETARSGRTPLADLTGGTISITNVGVFGVDTGTPILMPGEAAILAFGQIREMPWVHRGKIKVRKVTTLALSFDHRLVDGELGSAVLRDVGAALEDPLRMIAWS